jgi:hypothetical protein
VLKNALRAIARLGDWIMQTPWLAYARQSQFVTLGSAEPVRHRRRALNLDPHSLRSTPTLLDPRPNYFQVS